MLLGGKSIVITGANDGIGWAIAQAAHAAGANVVIHGRDATAVTARVAELGERAAPSIADLSNPEAPGQVIQACLDVFGRIDGLVNNAGIFPRNNLGNATLDSFETIFAVNARAPLFLCQEAYKAMQAQDLPEGSNDRGSIVNIGSINAHCGQTDILVYSMSKGALQTMTRNLGDALGPERIRVNQVNVGWTYTQKEHQTQLGEGRPENWLDEVPAVFAPSGSILMPEHIAPHVVFWLSESSFPTNGQVYEVEQYPVIGRNKIASA